MIHMSSGYRIEHSWFKVTFIYTISAHAEQACSVDFNSEFVVTGSDGCTVAVWDKETGQNVHLLSGHTQGVRHWQCVSTIWTCITWQGGLVFRLKTVLPNVPATQSMFQKWTKNNHNVTLQKLIINLWYTWYKWTGNTKKIMWLALHGLTLS